MFVFPAFSWSLPVTDARSMLTVQSAPPELVLKPFIRAYVQREAHLGSQELVEPVVARLGVMLEFEFAGSYEVRNYGTETVEDPNSISIIGPQSWRRSRLIIRGHVESLVVMFQPCGFHALFGVPTEPLAQTGTEGHSVLGPAATCCQEPGLQPKKPSSWILHVVKPIRRLAKSKRTMIAIFQRQKPTCCAALLCAPTTRSQKHPMESISQR
jgi:hypothetical protein